MDNFSDSDLPDLRVWSARQLYDYSKQVSSYEDLMELGSAITAARVALFKVTEQINKVERDEKIHKLRYERLYRREFLSSIEKTEAMKRMRAELACEGVENELVVFEQLKTELNRVSNTLRLELQTLQAIGNNLRQQLKIE